MQTLTLLPRRSGTICYRDRETGDLWGQEDWAITRGNDGLRVLSVHCEMEFGAENVVRDTVLSVHSDWHPHDAFVRIMNKGMVTGTGWFRFTDIEAECESWSLDAGRISQRFAIERPIRGFGIHAVQGDGWLAAAFPFEKGPGTTHFWPGRNLIHSLHHFGATGPYIHTSSSGLKFEGVETVSVAAGDFECNRVSFVGMTNNHPPYTMWISRCGDCLYVKGVVEGYMNAVFALERLEGERL